MHQINWYIVDEHGVVSQLKSRWFESLRGPMPLISELRTSVFLFINNGLTLDHYTGMWVTCLFYCKKI